jgi:hypothetical protein
MVPPWTYKSIRRDHAPGQYTPPDDLLISAGQEGWELVSVTAVQQILNAGFTEIFYFKQQGVAVA